MPVQLSRFLLGGSVLDPARRRRTDPAWLASAWSRAMVIPLYDQRVPLAAPAPPRLWLRHAKNLSTTPPDERFFLGVDPDGTPYFAVTRPAVPEAGVRLAALDEVAHLLGERDLALATTAIAVSNWAHRDRWCPRTGKPTALTAAGWRRLPPNGGSPLSPCVSPAVVTLVHDGVSGAAGQCLLVRGVSKPEGQLGCVSGYVEPGESAEAAVVREVFEEVGVTVDSPRYLASQPWPFPGQLMLAFTATADPGQPLRPDPVEIAEARWCRRDRLAADPLVRLPAPHAIAHYLVTSWLAEAGPYT